MRRVSGCLLVLLMVMFGSTVDVGATQVWYNDTQFGNTITYMLDFSETSPGSGIYDADFTVKNTGSAGTQYYAGWFTFKFATNHTQAPISGFSAAGWSVANTQVQVLANSIGPTYKDLLIGGSSPQNNGFYLTNLAPPTPDEPWLAIPVTSGTNLTTTFHFQFSPPAGKVHYDKDGLIPLQVGYYSDVGTTAPHWQATQLSKDLTLVPIPASLLLFAPGLAGLAVIRKRFGK